MIAQDIQWCVTVIQNASIRARKRNMRLSRDILMETLPEDSKLDFSDFDDIDLIDLLKSLSKIEAQVLYCNLILDLTQKEIARRLKISQQQVSRIKRRTINFLKKEAV